MRTRLATPKSAFDKALSVREFKAAIADRVIPENPM
jgi:hypothetical protein